MSPLSISVYASKILDIIQVLIAYKLQLQKQVSTLQRGVYSYTSQQVSCVKHRFNTFFDRVTVLNRLIFDTVYES